ncbi:MAG: hypothetical protein ACXACY_24695 [Candidatus Hodarchaeales archaeon]|jgi:hypothetical protein
MAKVRSFASYSEPNPFTTPTVEARATSAGTGPLAEFLTATGPVKLIQHEALVYSAFILEEIMFELNEERVSRGKTSLKWRAYKRVNENGQLEFDEFTPSKSPSSATNLNGLPVKFFPQYIKDIQDVITDLVEQNRYHDDIGSAMARIFLINTTHTENDTWGPKTALRTSYQAPQKGGQAELTGDNLGQQGLQTINALAASISGFPFPATITFVKDPTPRIGVDILGREYLLGDGDIDTSIVSSDPEWPRPSVGIVRTQENWLHTKQPNTEGQEVEGASTAGIDGVFIPMRPEGRAVHDRSIRSGSSLNRAAQGTADPESGYSFFTHHPLVIQQLRFQPPTIEHFGTEITARRDYVEAVFSNLTPNLPWYFSQPVEKQFFGDWGTWLMQGEVQMTGDAAFIRSYADPQNDNLFTDCPFSVFRPPPSSLCSCGGRNTAYAIWNSSFEFITWNQHFWSNPFINSGRPKQFGPKTRLRIAGDFFAGAGVGGDAYITVGVRTTKIANTDLQPFVNIISLGVGVEANNSIDPGSLDVNIMDAMEFHYPGQYQKTGVDFILAMAIFVSTSSEASAIVFAQDGPGGSFIPATDLGCALGESTATVDYIQLYEPPWDSGNDRNPSKGTGT